MRRRDFLGSIMGLILMALGLMPKKPEPEEDFFTISSLAMEEWIEDGKWHHVAMVRDSKYVNIVVDNKLVERRRIG